MTNPPSHRRIKGKRRFTSAIRKALGDIVAVVVVAVVEQVTKRKVKVSFGLIDHKTLEEFSPFSVVFGRFVFEEAPDLDKGKHTGDDIREEARIIGRKDNAVDKINEEYKRIDFEKSMKDAVSIFTFKFSVRRLGVFFFDSFRESVSGIAVESDGKEANESERESRLEEAEDRAGGGEEIFGEGEDQLFHFFWAFRV